MDLIGTIAIIAFFAWLIARGWRYDSTDDAQNKKRSGLTIYTDHKTGVQYVGTLFGGITPRLHASGDVMTSAQDR